MNDKIRSVYAILPEVVYQGSSTIDEHTDPLSGQVIAERDIYPGQTFAQAHPGARRNVAGTARVIKDATWERRDLFGIEQIIAMAGFASEVDGVQVYGIMQYQQVAALMSGPDWVLAEV